MKVTQFSTFTQFSTVTQCLILVTSLFFYAVCGPLPWARDEKQLSSIRSQALRYLHNSISSGKLRK